MEKTIYPILSSKDVLIITDMQKDFLPGGALPIKEGDLLLPVINEYITIFKSTKAKIIASRDWHPPNHMSFIQHGGPWSPHCVQGSEGAQFHPGLKLPDDVFVVSKATDPKREAYSVFDDTGLNEQLTVWGITRIFICGVATDYCIVNSTLDARKLGFDVVVLSDGTRGLDVKPGDVDEAFQTMADVGSMQATLTDFPEPEVVPDGLVEDVADKPLVKYDVKKKARMRPRGSYKQVRRERG